MRQIAAPELAAWLAETGRPQPFLLDVREPWEFEYCHIAGSTLMPMASVPLRLDEVPHGVPVVCICHHGGRSMQVALFLEARGRDAVFNLQGGVEAWARLVDTGMKRY